MNKNTSIFSYGIPVSAGIYDLDDTPLYLSPTHIMIITVLSGGVSITKGPREFNYKEGNIAITNADQQITLRTTRAGTTILIINLEPAHYRGQFPHIDSAIFEKAKPSIDNKLLPLLLESAFVLSEDNPESYSLINENIREVLSIALYDCQYFSEIIKENYSSSQTQQEYIRLMQSMLQFIDNNYADKISLSDFADQEHLSENYISHLIKKVSGTSFKELLAFIRCKKAETLLLDPNKRINEIAYNVGFSAPTYFKSNFSKFYKMTPEEYRSLHHDDILSDELPAEYTPMDARNIIRDFAAKHNIALSITAERFFTMDTVYIDRFIEYFQKVLSDEGSISNIDAEMNESSHEAFINMQKEFRMNIITLDAAILLDKAASGNQLTIATNINYLIWSKFKVRFVIETLSGNVVTGILRFLKFYSRRFKDTLDEIDFAVRVNAPEDILMRYKMALSERLHEEIGPHFNIEIDPEYIKDIKYYPSLYDSFILTPFAMDELFHPEKWNPGIDFSLIDAVSEGGHILAGGIGLLTWNGIKKPWWHAYNLSTKLKGIVVSKGPDHIITNNNGTITILTYNTCGMHPSFLLSLKNKQDLIDAVQNKSHIREHGFQLMNTFGKYKKTTYSVNETACLFSKWVDLGYPEYLTMEEELVFAQICHPEVKFTTLESNGKIDITTREESFGVTCVVLEKI